MSVSTSGPTPTPVTTRTPRPARSARVLWRHLALLVGCVLVLGTLAAAPASAADRDCGDFATQAAAQRFFLGHDPKADPHGLDSDGDMIACESNPCPCSDDTTPGPGQPPTNPPKPQIKQAARVVSVTDGDTIKVRLARGGTRSVRMIGIDTPEVYGGVECGGPQASRSLKSILKPRMRVVLMSDPTQDLNDHYGRILRYVHRRGNDVNAMQVRRGWARPYVYEKPFRRLSIYRDATRFAKKNRLGVYRLCNGRF